MDRRALGALTLLGSCVLIGSHGHARGGPIRELQRMPGAEADERADEVQERVDRDAYWLQRRAWPAATIPAGAYSAAHVEWSALKSRSQALDAPLSNATWSQVGPGSLETTIVKPNMSPAGGRVTTLAVHPTTPSTIYQGAALGGVWKSTDGGAAWAPLTDGQPNLSVGAIAIDPAAPDTVYVGTGEPNGADGYAGFGILKTTNGGATWTTLGAAEFDGASISKIEIRGGALYVGSVHGDAGTGGRCGPPYVATKYGMFRSTDGGATWTALYRGTRAIDFELDPGNTPAGALVSRVNNGVHHLDFASGVMTVVPSIPSNAERVSLSRSKTNPQVIYAGVGKNTTPAQGSIYVSTDGGATFTEIASAPDYCRTQCGYDNVIAADPADENVAYFGGSTCSAWKLTGGTTATPTFAAISMVTQGQVCDANQTGWTQAGVHSDLHSIVFGPSGRIYFGSDGGVTLSTDGGLTFSSLNVGISTLQLYQVCVDRSDVKALGAVMQDNGIAAHDPASASTVFQEFSTGDGTGCVMNLADPDPTKRFMLGALQYGSSYYYTDYSGAGRAAFDPKRTQGDRVLFVPPMTSDPGNPLRVFLGTYRVWTSTQGGAPGSWAAISDDLTLGASATDPCSGGTRADYLTAIGAAPSSAPRIYAGSTMGVVSTTSDGGTTWTQVQKAPLPGRAVTAIAASPTDDKIAYATFSGFSSVTAAARGHVFKTSDAGVTWTRVDASLDALDVPFNDIALHPTVPGILYAATDVGVMASNDDGLTWSALAAGIPNVAVLSLKYHAASSSLVAGTHGRSVWTLKLTPAIAASPTQLTFQAVAGGADPVAQTVKISNGDKAGSTLNFGASLAPAAPWLTVTPTTGKSAGASSVNVTATASIAGLAVGTYTTSIHVTDSNAPAPLDVAVTLRIDAPGTADAGGADSGGVGGADSGGGGDSGAGGGTDSGAPGGGNGATQTSGNSGGCASTPRAPSGGGVALLALAALASIRRRKR